jgi:hypothetical protein
LMTRELAKLPFDSVAFSPVKLNITYARDQMVIKCEGTALRSSAVDLTVTLHGLPSS